MRATLRTTILTCWLALGLTQAAVALTLVPADELKEGSMFDATSARSQKMQRILCFGRDPNYCASLDEPPRYYGMGFMCDWPELFAQNMTPDDQPNRKRFMLPGTGLQVGAATQGQLCYFQVTAFVPPSMTGTKDLDDLMAYVEWEFEREILPGLNGKVDGLKVILPYFLNSKRDGSHFKGPWDVRTPKHYQSNMTALPSRVKAVPQKSWMTLIINGQVIDKIEVPLTDQQVKWQIYDWRKKEKKFYETRHGTQG